MTQEMMMVIRMLLIAVCCIPLVFARAELKAQESGDAGFKSIFNGEDLKGWDGDPKFWRVEQGAIVGQTTRENPTRGNTFIIWKDGEVDDF